MSHATKGDMMAPTARAVSSCTCRQNWVVQRLGGSVDHDVRPAGERMLMIGGREGVIGYEPGS